MSLRCLAAADEAGIAVTMLPTLYKYGGFGGKPANEGQRRFLNDADSYLRIWQRLSEFVRGKSLFRLGISPHSLRAVTAELLREIIPQVSGPIHIHVAEQKKEVEDCLAWSGTRPITYLLDNFIVSDRWCGIHATHMTPEETVRMAESGMVAGLCPTTEANLGDGIFRCAEFLLNSGRICIGSDSHIEVNPASDLRQLEYSQRLRDLSRNVLATGPGQSTGRSLLEAVLAGAAQAMAQPVGKIAPGHRADIAVLDGDHPALIGREGDQVIDSWIFSGGNACVLDVFVAGRHVVKDRQHLNEAPIRKRFRAAVEKLMQQV
jgi:formimidoylglutamate deiminase